VEAASVDAVLAAWQSAGTPNARPIGGYVTNIQGNLAISANKQGVRIEPMATFRARRKK
jgi:tRNA(Ile)-lysidine synthase